MKKIITIFLALMMVLSLSICAFAASANPDAACGFDDESIITISKNYSLTKDGTVNPEESFLFTVTKEACEESSFYTLDTMPMLADTYDDNDADGIVNFSINYAEGEAKLAGDVNTFVLSLPSYDHVGVFTYKVTETAGDTAGVTYDSDVMYFTVTVLDDGEGNMVRVCSAPYKLDGTEINKDSMFENVFSASDMTVTKTVTGNAGEKDRYFTVNVTLNTPDGKEVDADLIEISGGSNDENPTSIAMDTETQFQVKHGDTITFSNLPYDVTYTVTEEDYTGDNYDAAEINFSDESKKIDTADTDIVEVINNKAVEVITGIILDSAPYAISLAGVAGAAALGLISKKRKATAED